MPVVSRKWSKVGSALTSTLPQTQNAGLTLGIAHQQAGFAEGKPGVVQLFFDIVRNSIFLQPWRVLLL